MSGIRNVLQSASVDVRELAGRRWQGEAGRPVDRARGPRRAKGSLTAEHPGTSCGQRGADRTQTHAERSTRVHVLGGATFVRCFT